MAAEHSGLRSIAVIRRVTGVRAGQRPRLAVLRRTGRAGSGRFAASVAARIGLGRRIARHTLGFGQSLRPTRRRRSMAPPDLSFVLRRRRQRPLPHRTRPAPVWPRTGRAVDETAVDRGRDGQGYETSDATTEFFDDLFDDDGFDSHSADEIGYEELVAETPVEGILARHEAFLGLPLRQASIMPPQLITRSASGAPLPLARPVPLAGPVSAIAPAWPMEIDPAGQESVSGAYETGPFVAPSTNETILAASGQDLPFGPTAFRVRGSAIAKPVAAGVRSAFAPHARGNAGLHALRPIGYERLRTAPGSSSHLSDAVAAKHTFAHVESLVQEVRAYRAAPVTLPLTRPFTLARAAAILRAAGAGGQTSLAWPAHRELRTDASLERHIAESALVRTSELPPRTFEVVGESYGTEAQGAAIVAGVSPQDVDLTTTASRAVRRADPVTAGAMDAVTIARALIDPAGAARLAGARRALSSIGDVLRLPEWVSTGDWAEGRPATRRAARMQVALPAADWPVAGRMASRIEPFARGLRQMHATASELVMRRPPGVAHRSFLGAETIQHLQWPATPRAAEQPSSQSALAPTDPTLSSLFSGPPPFEGPLPAPVTRVRRAMRVQPVDATLAPQYPIGTLAAPDLTSGTPGYLGRGVAGVAAARPAQWATPLAYVAEGAVASPLGALLHSEREQAQRAARTMAHVADETDTLPFDGLPLFVHRQAQHANWVHQLAVSAPPPFIAADPSGASALRSVGTMPGIVQRLAFAAERGVPHSAAARRSRDAASAADESGGLVLAPGAGGYFAAIQRRGWPTEQASSNAARWPDLSAPSPRTTRLATADSLQSAAVPLGAGQAASTGIPYSAESATIPRIGRAALELGTTHVNRFGRLHGAARRAEDVQPVFSAGWPAVASNLLLPQRQAQARIDGRRGMMTSVARALDSSGPSTSAAGTTVGIAHPTAGAAAEWWPSGLSLPFVRAWRRAMQKPSAAPQPPALRWPVFRRALPDAVDPGDVQRSVAAEAMAASAGQPLPPLVRRSMEHLFRMDLANVRVHSGSAAARATGAVAARAMAHGTDVYMPGGVTDSSRGDDLPLLAHELTHVAQHMGHRPPAAMPSLTLARRAVPEEQDADRIERMVSDAVHEQATVAREPATELTLARRPAPVTIMRVEEESSPSVTTGSTVSRAQGDVAEVKGATDEKADQQKNTDKLADEVFRRLERRLIVERERGGHRW